MMKLISDKCREIIVGFIKEFRVELILALLVAVSGASYIWLTYTNTVKERALRKESQNKYTFKVDIEEDSDNLIDTLYNDNYSVSKDIYLKYQVKNVGQTLGYYAIESSVDGGSSCGRVNIMVTEVEKLNEYPLFEKVEGGACIRLTIKAENLMGEDSLICANGWRCMLIDDNGYEIIGGNQLECEGNSLKLEECGYKLKCYGMYQKADNSVGYRPIAVNGSEMQYILFQKGESKTFKIVYYIPEKIVDDRRLVFTNGGALSSYAYENNGFSIYLNRHSEE